MSDNLDNTVDVVFFSSMLAGFLFRAGRFVAGVFVSVVRVIVTMEPCRLVKEGVVDGNSVFQPVL